MRDKLLTAVMGIGVTGSFLLVGFGLFQMITMPAASHDPVAENSVAVGAAEAELDLLRAEIAVLEAALEAAGKPLPAHGLVYENHLPEAFDDSCATVADTAVACDPLANDRDFEGDELSAAVTCGSGSHDGATYTPAAGFTGSDSCTVEVSDGGPHAMESELTVTVTEP